MPYFREANPAFQKLSAGILLFSLFNSSDLFLLMKIKATVHDDTTVIGAYIFYNLVFALSSFPLGAIGDKIGLKWTYITGLLLFAIVYTMMALGNSPTIFILAFLVYGFYAAATDGISKALITSIVPQNEAASAVGSLAGLSSLMALLSSLLTGLVWTYISGAAALLVSAFGALAAGVYLIFLKSYDSPNAR